MSTETDPPRRRLRLLLDLGADDLASLSRALHVIGNDLEHEGRESIPEPGRLSGGYDSGYHLTLTCDPEQTGDRFREQLETWRKSRVDGAPDGS